MARAKKEQWGELAAWHAAEIIRRLPFTGANLNPAEINPYRGAAPATSPAMERLEQWQRSRRIRALGQAAADAARGA